MNCVIIDAVNRKEEKGIMEENVKNALQELLNNGYDRIIKYNVKLCKDEPILYKMKKDKENKMELSKEHLMALSSLIYKMPINVCFNIEDLLKDDLKSNVYYKIEILNDDGYVIYSSPKRNTLHALMKDFFYQSDVINMYYIEILKVIECEYNNNKYNEMLCINNDAMDAR